MRHRRGGNAPRIIDDGKVLSLLPRANRIRDRMGEGGPRNIYDGGAKNISLHLHHRSERSRWRPRRRVRPSGAIF
jgi:hypothetical protein